MVSWICSARGGGGEMMAYWWESLGIPTLIQATKVVGRLVSTSSFSHTNPFSEMLLREVPWPCLLCISSSAKNEILGISDASVGVLRLLSSMHVEVKLLDAL